MPKRQGFTLIELSIVLVIIGLIIGGILGGQELIRQGEMRAVINQINMYNVAFNTFRNKYSALPGDMPDITNYFPTAANGNGDGLLYSGAGTGAAFGEDIKAWQDLSLAKMVPFQFTGTDYNTPHTIGVKVPEGPIKGTVFRFEGIPNWPSGNPTIYGRSGNNLRFNLVTPTNDFAAVFTPEEEMQLDKKIDDGIGGSGNFLGIRGYGLNFSDCLNGATSWADPGLKTYNLSMTTPTCMVSYMVTK